MVSAAISGEMDDIEYEHDDVFNLDIPKSINPILIPDEILNPKNVWTDEKSYQEACEKLAKEFTNNFNKKYPDMPDNIKSAGPKD
jgi:phosphoenolpyruvate carboxykinase (ATP)